MPSHSTPLNNSPGSAATSSSTSLFCGEDSDEVVTWEPDTSSSRHQFQSLYNHPQPSDENTISKLIGLEPHHMPSPDYLKRCQDRSGDVIARQDSINWILKVPHFSHIIPIHIYILLISVAMRQCRYMHTIILAQ